MESPSISIPWTSDTSEAASDTGMLLDQCWDLLGLDEIAMKTHNEPPAKKIKLEDESSESENGSPLMNIKQEAQEPVALPKVSRNTVLLELDDLLADFAPSINDSSYIETLSELEKVLNSPSTPVTDIKEEPLSPQTKSPEKFECPVSVMPKPAEDNVGNLKDLLSFAMEEIGMDEVDVNAIPETQTACTAIEPSLPVPIPKPQSFVRPTKQQLPVSFARQPQNHVHPITSRPMMRSDIHQRTYMAPNVISSTMTPMPALSRKRDRVPVMFYRHPHMQQMLHNPNQHLPPWLMQQHPGQRQFLVPVPQLPYRHLQQPVQHRIRIFPCPKCRRGFRAPEHRAAHVASGECTRVQRSVHLLPEGRGWQCVICSQYLQRGDIKMHLRAHNRDDISGNLIYQ